MWGSVAPLHDTVSLPWYTASLIDIDLSARDLLARADDGALREQALTAHPRGTRRTTGTWSPLSKGGGGERHQGPLSPQIQASRSQKKRPKEAMPPEGGVGKVQGCIRTAENHTRKGSGSGSARFYTLGGQWCVCLIRIAPSPGHPQ